MDRASGSGVFARDADALLDMVRLPVPEEARITMRNRRQIELCVRAMQSSMAVTRWQELVSDADLTSAPRMLEVCKRWLSPYERERLESALAAAEISIREMTAWRIEGTLREFASFEPVDLWFEHPVHHVDTEGALKDVKPDGGGGGSRAKTTTSTTSAARTGKATADGVTGATARQAVAAARSGKSGSSGIVTNSRGSYYKGLLV